MLRTPRRSIYRFSTWLALGAVMLGGVVLPMVHQAEHGMHAAAERAAHADCIVSGADAVAHAPHSGELHTDWTCVLCQSKSVAHVSAAAQSSGLLATVPGDMFRAFVPHASDAHTPPGRAPPVLRLVSA